MIIRNKYTGIALGIVLLAGLFNYKRLNDYTDLQYRKAPDAILHATPLRFVESSRQLGITNDHAYFTSNPNTKGFEPLYSMPPSLNVVDFNHDGFMDVFVINNDPAVPNRLFRNDGGKGFTDVAAEVGLDDTNAHAPPAVAAWFDINQDGLVDVLLGRYGCFSVYLQTPDGTFVDHTQQLLPNYCAFPRALAVADLNRDGWPDVYVGNFHSKKYLEQGHGFTPFEPLFNPEDIHQKGARNDILFGGPHGFSVYEVEAHRPFGDHTQSVGLSDVNNDGWTDVVVTNDYTFDALYLNRDGITYQDVTEQSLPRHLHGFSGMNVDFVDITQNGRLDLFISNGYTPPSSRKDNLLWVRKDDTTTRFEKQSAQFGIDRCGWAWSAKFGDFDNDGLLDLVVGNGRVRGPKATDPQSARSFAYARNEIRSSPVPLREAMRQSLPSFDRFHLFSFQRSCLFWQQNGRFYDVAPVSGITDTENGRSMALIDVDNNGKLDIVIANHGGPLLLYKNVTQTQGNWIGIDLVGPQGWRVPFGAKVTLIRSDGQPIIREVYPTNGHLAQTDPRLHFGLGDKTADSLIVTWPDGRREKFTNPEAITNTYVPLYYGLGDPVE
jgi:hypothetical protein